MLWSYVRVCTALTVLYYSLPVQCTLHCSVCTARMVASRVQGEVKRSDSSVLACCLQSPLYKECTECEPGDIYWRINELKTMQIIMVKTWVSMVKNVSNINMNVIILLDNLIEGKRLSYYGHFYCRNVLAFLKWHFLNIIWRFIKAKSRYFFDIFVVFCQLNS